MLNNVKQRATLCKRNGTIITGEEGYVIEGEISVIKHELWEF